jgi:hypothetical protein
MILAWFAGSSALLMLASSDAESNTPAILMLCFAITLALLFYTLYVPPGDVVEAPEKSRATFLRERKEAVYENLRDLNFENKAGKLAADDYQKMHAELEEEAAALLAEIDRLESPAAASLTAATGARRSRLSVRKGAQL